MNFELTDDQRAIKRTAREMLASRYRPETVRELAADERGFTDARTFTTRLPHKTTQTTLTLNG